MLLNQLSRALYEIISTQKTNLYINIYIIYICTLYTFVYIFFFRGGWGEEGVDEKNIPNRTTTISMFLYIILAQQNTSIIDIIFKPFVKHDNSLLGNPMCKTVSIFYGEIDQKIV